MDWIDFINRVGIPGVALLGALLVFYRLGLKFSTSYADNQQLNAQMLTRTLTLLGEFGKTIDGLRTSNEAIAAASNAVQEATVDVVRANTFAIQSNTAQIDDMGKSLVTSITEHLSTVTADHRAMQAQLAEYALRTERERAEILAAQQQALNGMEAMQQQMATHMQGLDLLSSAIDTDIKENRAAHEITWKMAEDLKRVANALEGMPEAVASRLSPMLQPLMETVERLVTMVEGQRAAAQTSEGPMKDL